MAKKKRQYGLWSSELSPQMLAQAARLSDVQWARDGERLVWLQGMDGRGVLMVQRPGQAARPINDELSVRGTVGYGGGEFSVGHGVVIFAARDGRLYRAELDRGTPQAITPKWGNASAPVLSPDGRWVAYVHRHDEVDRIALVDAMGKRWPTIACEGADFYMQPTFSPGGDRLLWASWDHPFMPWHHAIISGADLDLDAPGGPVVGPATTIYDEPDVAAQLPQISPDGRRLAYLSDATGRWQLVVRELESGGERIVSRRDREYGGPAWIQGLRYFQWTTDGTGLVCISTHEGIAEVERISLGSSSNAEPTSEVVECLGEYTHFRQISVNQEGDVAVIGESSMIPARVVVASAAGKCRVAAFSSSERLGEEFLAEVRPVSWPVDDPGPVESVHGLFYPPTNPAFEAEGAPPALVMIHGGPTSQREARFEPRNQFFASRGWAVLDVNYRGSTGYGRDYMEALFGRWGVADVEDAVGAARYLGAQGLADPDKIVIMGGSAGGYTVLQTLVRHPGVFKAGVCLYGISDLFTLQMGTHKFEERYNDTLIGPLPEAADRYRERSPIRSAVSISDAVALYHGAKDKVVPPDQAADIARQLARNGVPHLHHVYEDEGHGWRRAETIVHFHRSLLEFLTRHVLYA